MIATRPDWCISRQRVWGVPIIGVLLRGLPRTAHRSQDAGSRGGAVPQHTADVWYRAHAPRNCWPAGMQCAKCGGGDVPQGDRHSGRVVRFRIEPSGGADAANGLPWPSDMYLEGGDQYRGWFHSSLLIGVGLKGGAPYRACATNGWTLDGEGTRDAQVAGQRHRARDDHQATTARSCCGCGRRRSISPKTCASRRPSQTRLIEAYRKLRNTFRYMLGQPARLRSGDGRRARRPNCWRSTAGSCCAPRTWCDAAAAGTTSFEFHKVYRAVYDFATVDLSSIYFDVLKDRLYTAATKSQRATQRADRARIACWMRWCGCWRRS